MDQYLSEGVRAGETLKVTLPLLFFHGTGFIGVDESTLSL